MSKPNHFNTTNMGAIMILNVYLWIYIHKYTRMDNIMSVTNIGRKGNENIFTLKKYVYTTIDGAINIVPCHVVWGPYHYKDVVVPV